MPFKRLNLTNMQYTALRLMTHRAVRKSLNPTSVMATPSMLAQRRTLINNESRGRSTDPGGAYSTSNKAEGTIKRWPHPVVESHGDYRAEAYLEAVIGGPLYAKQSKLPRLPIPSVHETLKRFLPTALPLAESEIEKQNLLDVCAKFAQESTKLQARLQAYCKGEMKESSWLQLWWNTAGYLQVRDPAVVNVSYFFHFSDDGTLPDPTDDMSLGVMRGAAILVAAAEFRKKVCSGTLPEESIGRKEPKTSLCSVAFKYMFNACRIPRRDQDSYRMYDPSLNTHCIVARKGHFFAVDFVDDHGDPLPLAVLERRLQRVIEHADEAEGSNDVPMLGWLTSCNRDSWADARDELIRAGGSKMEQALARLESGALMLCLDDEEPISRKQCSNIFWTGSTTSGQNRWFDKSIQIMCTNNGKAGLLGEHSMMDGMPMVGLADHITKMTYRNAEAKALAKAEKDTVVGDGGVKDLFRECTGDMNSSSSRVKECVHKGKILSYRVISSQY
jgi:carnitine O-acetyltransferase